jgi:hypothetical protein
MAPSKVVKMVLEKKSAVAAAQKAARPSEVQLPGLRKFGRPLGCVDLMIVELERATNFMPCWLEVEPQCDLNDARGSVSQPSSRTQNLTECRAQDIGVRVGEFGVIKEIEKIPA